MVLATMIHPTEVLKQQIESKRNQMIIAGMEDGLSHPSTLKFSRELDLLLNRYNQTIDNQG